MKLFSCNKQLTKIFCRSSVSQGITFKMC
uniref:Uncharacterized protein n=1 Tax=Arundo donax TaxID=35708 RepID=A0A0A9C1Q0_ARUDO